MAGLERFPNEVIVYESRVQHLRQKWRVVIRTLTLTNQRLVLQKTGLDPFSDALSWRTLLGFFLPKLRSPSQPVFEARLNEIAAIARAKFGLNNRILVVETSAGQEHRMGVDDFDAWLATLRNTIHSTNRLTTVEVEPNRWLVKRTPDGSQ